MKGTVFVELMEHVESRYGLEVLDAVIAAAGDRLSTGGAYTSVGNYPHGELLELVVAVCQVSGASLETLLDDFAEAMMRAFERMHPEFFAPDQDIFEFLQSLESRIHADVRKLYPDARPPLILARRSGADCLEMTYQSARPLAPFAIALVRAAAHKFRQPLSLDVLMLSDDHRDLRLQLRRQTRA